MHSETTASRTHDPLLQPFTLKGLTLRNRIISTSHASMLDDGGMPGDRYRAYHVQKARGGVAMTMIGGSAMVSPDSSWGGGQLNMADDAIIPDLARLAEEVHAQGAAVMTQISHLGRRAQSSTKSWLPVLAPSRVRESRNRAFPLEMGPEDIERIIHDYAKAALRAKQAGLDGVETLTGGHLIGQFLSPLTNQRSDGFGGSLQNRAQFARRVHEAIRQAVGPDYPVGIRLTVDEGVEGGLALGEGIALAQMFERDGTIDFFNCVYGMMDSDLALSQDNMPGMFQKSAPYLATVQQFRNEISLPLIHAGGIRDTATARYVIRENLMDLVGMTRAHIADPDIVAKLQSGREEQIRPCVGASYCLYRKSHCIHNVSTTRERGLGHDAGKAGQAKHVVVVGGGPAGLEAARISAQRGHRVTLFEAAAKLGGQLRLATLVAERADLVGILDWREAELERLGVDVRLNSYADAQDIVSLAPEVVIVATGGLPDTDFVDGGDLCLSVWDMLGAPLPEGEFLVYDGTGRQAAPSCVLEAVRQGRKVGFVTPDEATCLEMPYPDRSGFRKLFAQHDIARTTDARLVRVQRHENRLMAEFQDCYSQKTFTKIADHIVLEHGTIPFSDVFDTLRDASRNNGRCDSDALVQGRPQPEDTFDMTKDFTLYRIGDVISSRDIHAAILDGYRVAKGL
ncbi:NADH:flavin oxidoreductase [Rhodobacteraceae bacterium]|nr:NADH:flavin oxidoreductase [Paracoccaceae bacterium]